MKTRWRRSTLILAAAFAAIGPVAAQTLPGGAAAAAIDPSRSDVRFTVTKFGFDDVTGVFGAFEGEIRYDPARPEASSVRWRVRVDSVRTDATTRDRVLQSVEYFDAASHPALTFVSREVRARDHTLEVTGDITIRGVTRPLVVIVRPRVDRGVTIFESDFELDRYDFGVAGGSVMGRLIGRRVRVRLRAALQLPSPRIVSLPY